MSEGSAVAIGLLLPDVLGTYGDRGNATVLAQRLRWRGIAARVVPIRAESRPPVSCDIYVIGGGEDAAQHFAADWLMKHPDLRRALGRSHVLAVCAGLQVLGLWMRDAGGRTRPGAAVLPLTTVAHGRRAVGEVVARCRIPGIGLLTGFENHAGRTTLAPELNALGDVLHGVGNGDRGDGVLTGGVVGTYLHGPVLARNPALADLLLSRAVGEELAPLAVADQEAARNAHLAGHGSRSWRRRRFRAGAGGTAAG